MDKVQMQYLDKVVLVDQDQVKHLKKKEALVNAAMSAKANGIDGSDLIRKIIKLNRRIRQNVIVVQ